MTTMNLNNHIPFDNKKYQFISVPEWCGGSGLGTLPNPTKNNAIPERKPGKRVKTSLGDGVIVSTHNCESNFWYDEGVLVAGTFYIPRWRA